MSEDEDRDDAEAEKVPLSDLKEEVAGDEREESDSQAMEGAGSGGEPEPNGEIDDPIPLSELREDVDARRDDATQSGEHFQQEGLEKPVESEAVWADLLMSEGDSGGMLDPTAIEEGPDRTYQVVPTTLCHRCRYFGDPPELHCTHEGTTIHETVDMDHYRVSKCPMVGEDPEEPGHEQ